MRKYASYLSCEVLIELSTAADSANHWGYKKQTNKHRLFLHSVFLTNLYKIYNSSSLHTEKIDCALNKNLRIYLVQGLAHSECLMNDW